MTARRASRPEPASKAPRGLTIRYELLDELLPDPRNARTHDASQITAIARSLGEFGWATPMGTADGKLIYGHARRQAAIQLRDAGIRIPRNPDPARGPVVDLSYLKPAQRRAYMLADNQLPTLAAWDRDILASELLDLRTDGFDLSLTGFDALGLDGLLGDGLGGDGGSGNGAGSLAAQFGIPPFSVLNAREGWWQDRKRAWLALGIQSEIGRGDQPGTSARVGPDDEATYRTIGGRKPNAIPGGAGQNAVVRDMGKALRANATPGGTLMPAADYSKRQRGDGRGRAI